MNKPQVLVADDELLCRTSLAGILKSWDYGVIEAKDGREALRILDEPNGPRLAIIDWVMPKIDGLNVCKLIRQSRTDCYVYIILLSSKSDRNDVVDGLKAGADDFLIKPFDPAELEQRLRSGLRVLDLEDRLIAARKTLEYQATRDDLTGIWNRRAILEHLNREVHRSRRNGDPISIAMIDVDHFKRINDTYGHLVGDQALQTTARIIRDKLRPHDMIGRYGGEEFLSVVPNADLEQVAALADRLRRTLEETPIDLGGSKLHLSVSMGVSTAYGDEIATIDPLLHAADEALYKAKHDGRNRVCAVECTPNGTAETSRPLAAV